MFPLPPPPSDKCCVNVHVSRLLEHWLDWDRDLASKRGGGSQDYEDSSSNGSNGGGSTNNTTDEDDDDDDDDTAKSLSLSPSPPLQRRRRRRQAGCRGVSAEADLSQVTLAEILESQLAVGEEKEEEEMEEDEEEVEGDLQSWLRRFFHARGCDQDPEEEADSLASFLTYLLKGNPPKKCKFDFSTCLLNYFSFFFSFQGNIGAHLEGTVLVQLVELALERLRQLRREQQQLKQQRETGAALSSSSSSSSLLPQVQHLLRRGLYREAEATARAILLRPAAGADSDPDPDAPDPDTGRTLLTHAVEHADAAVGLTRLLVNCGAKVWPEEEATAATAATAATPKGDLVARLASERERSAFTWFLRGAMARCAMACGATGAGATGAGDLAGAGETLDLLGTAMGESPARMRRHVTRTMLALGRGAALNGALFLQLRLRLSPWWRQPQPLRHQSARRVRRALGPKRLSDDRAVAALGLPRKLGRYVRMEEGRKP